MESEAELIARAKAGDDAAFGALVKRYLNPVFNFLLHYTGNEAIAEDATQDAFVKAWKALKRFDESKPLTPWLLRIARNAANDILRRKRPSLFTDLATKESDTAFEDTLEDPAPLPPELYAQKELGAHVAAALEGLPERDRAILVLRYMEGLPFEEIAAAFGAPVNTVKSWHRRALLGLREALAHFAPKRDYEA